MKNDLQQLIGKVKLGAKRNAPELLLGGALLTGTACVVTASVATVKANFIVDEFRYSKEDIADRIGEDYSKEEAAKDLKKLYISTGIELSKNYAIPFALYAATVAGVFGSYKIQKKRQIALSAALATVSASYAALMTKLKKGAEYGLTAEDIINGVEIEETIDESGVVTGNKVQGEAVTDLYKFRFDKYSTAWENDKFQNISTLRGEENWANDKLRLQGYLFLNDVLDRLGMPRTKAGQVVGWISNGKGDCFVDFGTVDCDTYDDVRFDNNAFDLNFNVDGDILTKF